MLLDLGSGALSKLRLALDFHQLDAVVISHMHADHFFDLVPLRYGLKYGGRRADRLALWVPPGGIRALNALRKAVSLDAPDDFFESVYAVREYDPSEPLQVGDVQLRFAHTRHYVEAYAIRAEVDGGSLVYSADTAPSPAVVDHARGATIFLCESALGVSSEEGQERGHCSAFEAGEMAAKAGAAHLVLTHYPGETPAQLLVEAAQSRYGGPVTLAQDGLQLSVLGSSLGSEN